MPQNSKTALAGAVQEISISISNDSPILADHATAEKTPQKTLAREMSTRDCLKYGVEVSKTVEFLRDRGYPALPVAPEFSADEYPVKDRNGQPLPDVRNGGYKQAFTGKNPSFLGSNGKPYPVRHTNYQEQLPTDQEITKWWVSKQPTGVGTLGGWNDTYWVDFDVKNFDNKETLDEVFNALLSAHPELKDSWIEQTHSGGYRLAVKIATEPGFTNFAMEPGGKHRGEVLGAGRFTVLAPTIGPSGNPYFCINRGEPALIESLEAIGIFSNKKPKGEAPTPIQSARLSDAPSAESISLENLITDNCRKVLGGEDVDGDRSASLTKLINEAAGWVNWARSNGISISGSVEDLATSSGQAMGLDLERIGRILATVDTQACHPAALQSGGDDSCWKKVRRLNRKVYKEQAPQAIKQVLDAPTVTASDRPALVDFGKEGKVLLKPQSSVASILAEENRDRILFCHAAESFYLYNSNLGIWKAEPEISMRSMVMAELDSRGAIGYGDAYISGIVRLMGTYLYQKDLSPKAGLLPMRNGALDIKTLELLPHQPGYHFTSVLPYEYDPAATCEPIKQWLLEAQDGDEGRCQLIRAYFRAIATGRVDLQKYVEFLGGGGTGKSTAANLAISLVGIENTATTTLRELEQNRFETSNLKGKRLIYITDSERYNGPVSVLKSITGGDPLRNEQKFKQAADPFFCQGMVLVVSNEPIATTDYTGGLARRRETIPFTRKVAPKDRRDLLTVNAAGASGEFAEYLPGLLNWVLALPEQDMRRLILQTSEEVPSLTKWKHEVLLETNPIAEWFDECCILTPDLKTYVGLAKKERETIGEPGDTTSREYYQNESTWLYANYRAHCDHVGGSAIKVQRFSRLLMDLLVNQLNIEAFKGRDRDGAYIKGISLRGSDDLPPPISGCDGFLATCDEPVTNSVTTQTLTGVDSQPCDGFSQSLLKTEETSSKEPPHHVEILDSVASRDEKPSQSSKSTPVRLPVVTRYVTDTSHVIEKPSRRPIEVGDRVRYTGEKFKVCQGIDLEVYSISAVDGVTCLQPNGRLTTWLPIKHLAIAPALPETAEDEDGWEDV